MQQAKKSLYLQWAAGGGQRSVSLIYANEPNLGGVGGYINPPTCHSLHSPPGLASSEEMEIVVLLQIDQTRNVNVYI